MTRLETFLNALRKEDTFFVIIGGVAATIHGSARLTNDLDIAYERSAPNLERVVRALAAFEPYLRGAPEGLPFRWDVPTIKAGLNFTLRTTIGDIDLLGEVTGLGSFSDVLRQSIDVKLFGATYRVIDLDALITAKRAAGRAKDLEVVAELEAIREERHGNRP
jgi:predicted nucleotidyltransferase